MKRIYIAGKIGDLPETQYRPKFDLCKKYLEEKGYIVISPIDLLHDHDKTWASYMMECLNALIPCDAICMLDNYTSSPGATIELAFARGMGKEVVYEL